ncbi:hypothetical protein K469DRAFT_616662, partial [Zopfia rhizophila CBS 207.26]
MHCYEKGSRFPLVTCTYTRSTFISCRSVLKEATEGPMKWLYTLSSPIPRGSLGTCSSGCCANRVACTSSFGDITMEFSTFMRTVSQRSMSKRVLLRRLTNTMSRNGGEPDFSRNDASVGRNRASTLSRIFGMARQEEDGEQQRYGHPGLTFMRSGRPSAPILIPDSGSPYGFGIPIPGSGSPSAPTNIVGRGRGLSSLEMIAAVGINDRLPVGYLAPVESVADRASTAA